MAIARGTEKEELARELGAHHYIDSTATDPAEELQKLGGAKVILSTVTAAPAMNAVLGGLGLRGRMILVGADVQPVEVVPVAVIGGNLEVAGHASGTSIDSRTRCASAPSPASAPRIETLPLEQAAEAYERMMAGDARFRMVLTTGA